MDIETKLTGLFEDKGIYLSEQDKNDILELDSIQFISIIIDIENLFCIKIDDEYLLPDKLKTFNDFLVAIKNIIGNSNNS